MRLPDLPRYRDHRILEPRLRSLLDLGPDKLFQLYQSERRRVDATVAEVERLQELLRSASTADVDMLKLRIAYAQSALLTARTFAVHYPGNQPTAGYVSTVIWSDAGAEDLTAAGVRIRGRAVHMFTGDIPLDLLWPLAVRRDREPLDLSAAFRYVELARPWSLDLTLAIPIAGLDTLQASGVRGNGVVIGIIDSGIDIYHPHFIDGGTGVSRIEYLWDQTLVPGGSEHGPSSGTHFSGNYGVEYGKADITADLQAAPPPHQIVRSRDIEGHGTLVASCAASSGHLDSGAPSYLGAAPAASIVAVKVDGGRERRIFADSSSVLDAAGYIFDRAASLGLPCVINLSMSDAMGAHDGTTDGEQYLDELLLTPGRAIVCSAGNQNTAGLHFSGVVPAAGMTFDLGYVSLPSTDPAIPPLEPRFNDSFQIWYDGHDRLTLTIDVPSTPRLTVGPVAAGASTVATIPGTSISIEVNSVLGDPRNGDNLIDIVIDNPLAESIPHGTFKVPNPWHWNLVPTGGSALISGAFDAWADRQIIPMRAWTGAVLNVTTLGVPSTATRPITVGGHARNLSGGTAPGPMLITSGCGPTRDGRIKPELCASGEITAAWSKDADNAAAALLRTTSGTSVAAPLVAGAAALMFECHGSTLSSSDVKQLLLDAIVQSSLGHPNARGFGSLNVTGACMKPLSTTDVWIRDSNLDNGVEPYTGADPPFSSPDIVVLDVAGNPVANPQFDPGNPWNNRIDVTVRNRGTGEARNVDVYLYWTDPATYIPFPSAWYSSGIYTGQPAFVTESNRIVVDRIPAGGSQTVQFAWAPPVPGSNIRGDAHFCLIARVEHEADASNLASGGWGVIAGSNNIAMRNVLVLDVAVPAAPTGLRVVGSGDMDTMEFSGEGFSGHYEVILPTSILPWRELKTLATLPAEARGRIGIGDQFQRDLDARAAARILGVSGASRAQVRGPLTHLRVEGKRPRLDLPVLRLRENAAAAVRVTIGSVQLLEESGFLNIAQRSGGKLVGGVQIEFRRELPPPTRYIVTHDGDDVTVRKLGADEHPDRETVRRGIPPQWRQLRRRTTV